MWPPQPGCPQRCIGLPEEMKWRRAALARGLAVIGISSQDRVGRGCWFEVKKDHGSSAARVARTVMRRAGLEGLPVYTMGVSGGAYLAMSLPAVMPEVKGVYAQVRAHPPEDFILPGGRPYPPVAFVHMAARDPQNAAGVWEDLEVLRKMGTPAAEVRTYPRTVTVAYLTARGEGHIDVPMAHAILNKLKEIGWLTEKGELTKNTWPTMKDWAPLVAPVAGNLSLVRDHSVLGECLNAAFARHEFVHDRVDAVLTWLMEGGAGGQERMDALVADDKVKDLAAAAAWGKQVKAVEKALGLG